MLDAVYSTGGTAIAVDDHALLAEQREVARLEGCFVCPEGAACFAAVRQLRDSGWLSGGEQVVVLNTGTGLKYPETVPVRAGADVPVLAPGDEITAKIGNASVGGNADGRR